MEKKNWHIYISDVILSHETNDDLHSTGRTFKLVFFSFCSAWASLVICILGKWHKMNISHFQFSADDDDSSLHIEQHRIKIYATNYHHFQRNQFEFIYILPKIKYQKLTNWIRPLKRALERTDKRIRCSHV